MQGIVKMALSVIMTVLAVVAILVAWLMKLYITKISSNPKALRNVITGMQVMITIVGILLIAMSWIPHGLI